MKDTSLTRPQLAAYWRAASAAAREVGEPLEAYRKRVMCEECGVESLKELNRTSDFDRVMLRFATDAEDYEAAMRYTGGDDSRLSALVRDCVIQVLLLADSPADPGAYVRAILRQSLIRAETAADMFVGVSDLMLDIDAGSVRKVFQMLDTHRRRLLRRVGYAGSLAFQMGTRLRMVGGVVAVADPATIPIVNIRLSAA